MISFLRVKERKKENIVWFSPYLVVVNIVPQLFGWSVCTCSDSCSRCVLAGKSCWKQRKLNFNVNINGRVYVKVSSLVKNFLPGGNRGDSGSIKLASGLEAPGLTTTSFRAKPKSPILTWKLVGRSSWRCRSPWRKMFLGWKEKIMKASVKQEHHV